MEMIWQRVSAICSENPYVPLADFQTLSEDSEQVEAVTHGLVGVGDANLPLLVKSLSHSGKRDLIVNCVGGTDKAVRLKIRYQTTTRDLEPPAGFMIRLHQDLDIHKAHTFCGG